MEYIFKLLHTYEKKISNLNNVSLDFESEIQDNYYIYIGLSINEMKYIRSLFVGCTIIDYSGSPWIEFADNCVCITPAVRLG